MVRSAWVFRRLRNWRSGIEGVISTLKRAFRMDRCTWRGLPSFRAYVGACVTSFNLLVLARYHLLREFA
ncbi:MAG: transposase [Gammaproteobacteria bacterium]|nr:transposase [Gammaproteobacteria bacterium]NIR81698.1 transposase [Gammaproteobacteria bacterium]NIV73543.1 transposase [Gammaproteobacteria bacterium]